MPAKNPRLTITLQPVLAAQLRRLSELTGNSQSALIAELLEGSEPIFTRMIQVLEAAEQAVWLQHEAAHIAGPAFIADELAHAVKAAYARFL